MAHGENAEKGGKRGKEYWKSRLHKGGEVLGRFTKDRTHRKERRDSKKITEDAVEEWMREKPLTVEELARYRDDALAHFAKHGISVPDMFTCDSCADRFVCKLVFDAYNTDGDCLMEK